MTLGADPVHRIGVRRDATPPAWAGPVPIASDGSIDLLPLVEIKPDAKLDTDWTRDGQALVAPRQGSVGLPIPISLAGDYDLLLTAELERVEKLTVLLQADGHPCEAALGEGGNVNGLQSIDQQGVSSNETVVRERLVQRGQKFRLTCQVRRNQIRLLLDDKPFVDWEGKFERLGAIGSQEIKATDGHLGVWADAPCRIHELKLSPCSDAAKRSVTIGGDRPAAVKLREKGAQLTYRRGNQPSHFLLAEEQLPDGFLRVLDVRYGLLSDTDMPDFSRLLASFPQLEQLWLEDSDVTDDGLKQLPELDRLTCFSLRSTLVRNPVAALSIEPTRLTELHVDNTNLSDEGLLELGRCSSLGRLFLASDRLTDKRLLGLPVLPKLESLSVPDNPLELGEQLIHHLAKFVSLRGLEASKIPASEEGLMRLAQLKQLERLALDETRTTDPVLAELQKMPKLGWLSIKNTPATEAGVKTFRAALPNCRVEWSPAP